MFTILRFIFSWSEVVSLTKYAASQNLYAPFNSRQCGCGGASGIKVNKFWLNGGEEPLSSE